MAEVPEVETLVRDLREAAVGRTILETEVFLPAAVRFPTVEEFTNLLANRVKEEFWSEMRVLHY
jgi:formamidopyrimidine-DNA glycosylase